MPKSWLTKKGKQLLFKIEARSLLDEKGKIEIKGRKEGDEE